MNRLTSAAAAATLVALAAAALGGDHRVPVVREDAPGDERLVLTQGRVSLGQGQDPSSYGGFADAATAGQAYYGWRYPFALPLAAALAAATAPEKTKPE